MQMSSPVCAAGGSAATPKAYIFHRVPLRPLDLIYPLFDESVDQNGNCCTTRKKNAQNKNACVTVFSGEVL